MKKLKVICYINSAGINVNYDNIQDTISSIDKNINTEYKFFIVTDSSEHKKRIEDIILKNSLEERTIEVKVDQRSWAECFNSFFESFKIYEVASIKSSIFRFFPVRLPGLPLK